MLPSGLIGVLSLIVGGACLYLSRSQWLSERMRKKYAGAEDVEDRLSKQRRDWTWIGIFWLLFGVLQVILNI
ncbi:MAG: hypothetical protein R6U70_05145 [Bacillota bacterium]